MRNAILLVVTLPLTACTSAPAGLADLPPMQVEFDAFNRMPLAPYAGPNMVDVFLRPTDSSCPTLDASVTGTLDGVPMTILQRGGENAGYDHAVCDPIELTLETAVPKPGEVSTLVLADGGTTWTIAARDLFTTDFELIGTIAPDEHVSIRWPSADVIPATTIAAIYDSAGERVWTTSASDHGESSAASFTGNVIDVRLPSAATPANVLSIETGRELDPVTCEGPTTCLIYLSASAEFRH